MHIALLAGEVSGDLLGAPLVRELKQRYPHARFSGIGGTNMQAEGFNSLTEMARLSVMGLAEVLGHLPDLWRVKSMLLDYWRKDPPDLFIGIDAPDFNLRIAGALHRQGIKTAHYVSPSLWAWKEKRIETIKENIDIMLCLFPFETHIYAKHGVRAVCVGHPLCDRLKPMPQQQAREQLHLPQNIPLLGLFPGSRQGEIQRLLPVFLAAYRQLKTQITEMEGVLSLLTDNADYRNALAATPDIHQRAANSAVMISACDVVLLASGTITLESALLQRPMVAAYRVNPLTAAVAKRLLKIQRFSLPNLLAKADLVPECIQKDCTPEKLTAALQPLFTAPGAVDRQLAGFRQIIDALPRRVSHRAVNALRPYLEA